MLDIFFFTVYLFHVEFCANYDDGVIGTWHQLSSNSDV
jgi:hypothetical protein